MRSPGGRFAAVARVRMRNAMGMVLTTILLSCTPNESGSLTGIGNIPEGHAPAAVDPARSNKGVVALAERNDRSARQSTVPAAVIVPGSGVFAVAPKANQRFRVEADPSGDILTLHFVEADIRDVVRTILGDTLGLNYTVAPDVQGTVTLQTSRGVPRSDVLATLESVLRLNGFVLAQAGGIYRVSSSEAARGSVAPRLGMIPASSGDAYGIQVVPLTFTSAAEMAKILEPLVASSAVLRAVPGRNILILAGTREERSVLLEMMEVFDVDWLAGMSFAMAPLQFAKPEEVITDLDRIFGSEAEGPLSGVLRFYPVARRNAVLVISQRPEYLERAQEWLHRLDVSADDEQQLFIYYVENGRAADLAAVLEQVLGVASARRPSGELAPGLRAARLQLPVSSTPLGGSAPLSGQREGAFAAGPATAIPAGRDHETEVPPPPSAAGPGAGSSVTRITSAPAETEVRIIADEVNNALVIMAKPRTYRMIEAALHRLDIVPLQVLIEATIAEVTLNNELRYGVQWFFTRQKGGHENSITLSGVESGAIAATFPGFAYVFSRGADVRLVLDALKSMTDVNVVSAPQVMVLDNRTAELLVGDQVPIVTRSARSAEDATAPIVNSVQFRDTGVSLKVTPRVNASGLVSLDIDQEVSDAVATTTSGIDSPTIQQRRIASSIAVRSGETIALGGLIRDNRSNTKSGMPILGDVPILGSLFSSTSDTGRRTELLVLITPRVVRNDDEARAVTSDLRRMLRSASDLESRR